MKYAPDLLFVAVVMVSLVTIGCSNYQATQWLTGILATIGAIACLWLIGSKDT